MKRTALTLWLLTLLSAVAFGQARQPVNTGTSPNDGTGDNLRVAFTKLNANDNALWNTVFTNLHIDVKSRHGAVGDTVMVEDFSWPPSPYTPGTDDTAALQAAIDQVLAQGGGTVFIPKGTYRITAPLVINKAGPARIKLQGVGANASRIVANGPHFCLEIKSPATGNANKCQMLSVVDLGFANVNSSTNSGLVRITDAKWVSMHRVVGWGGHVGLELSALSELSAIACFIQNQSWTSLHTRFASGNPAPDLAALTFLECNFLNSSTYACVLDYFRHITFYGGGISSQLPGVSAGVWISARDTYCNTAIFRDVSFESEEYGTTPALQIGRFDGGTPNNIDNVILDHCFMGTMSRWCRVGAAYFTEPVLMRECNFYGNIATQSPLFDLTTNAVPATNKFSWRLKAENCFPAIELYQRDNRPGNFVDPKLTYGWPTLQNPASHSALFGGLDFIEGNDEWILDANPTNVFAPVSPVSLRMDSPTNRFTVMPFTRSGQYVTVPLGTTVYAEAVFKWPNGYPPQLFAWRRPDFTSLLWGNAEGAYETYVVQSLTNGFHRVFARTRVTDPRGLDAILVINQAEPFKTPWLASLKWYADLPSGDSIPVVRSSTRLTKGWVGPGQRIRLGEKPGVGFASQTGFELTTISEGWLSRPWEASAPVFKGDLVTSETNTYVCVISGTNAPVVALTGTGTVTNGTAVFEWLFAGDGRATVKPVYPYVSGAPTSPTSAGSFGLQALDTTGGQPMAFVHDGNTWFQHRLTPVNSVESFPDYVWTNAPPSSPTDPGRYSMHGIDTSGGQPKAYLHDGTSWFQYRLTPLDNVLSYPDYVWTNSPPASPSSPGRYTMHALGTGLAQPMGYVHDGNSWWQYRVAPVETAMSYPDYVFTNSIPTSAGNPGKYAMRALDTTGGQPKAFVHDGSSWFQYRVSPLDTVNSYPDHVWTNTPPSAASSPGRFGMQAAATGITWPMRYFHDGNNWFQTRTRLVDTGDVTYPDYVSTNSTPSSTTSPGRFGMFRIDTSGSPKYLYVHDGNSWFRVAIDGW